jgi:hypothetical protein
MALRYGSVSAIVNRQLPLTANPLSY